MRGFLGFVLLLVVALVAAALVLVPIVVRPVVVDAVRDASPFGDQPLGVDVDINPVALLLGTIDRIHVTGEDLRAEAADIGGLDLTITDVSAGAHTFSRLTGRLTAVTLPFTPGSPLVVDSLDLSGSSGEVEAVARLDIRGSLTLIGNAFEEAGVAVEGLELVDGGVSFLVFGQPVQVAVGADGGALVLADVAGTGPFAIVEPGPDDPWRVTGVSVTPSGIEVFATLEPQDVLRGS